MKPSLRDDYISQIRLVSLLGFVAVYQGVCKAKRKHGPSTGRASSGNFGENLLSLKTETDIE